jgi:hypothetical protein
MFPVFRVEAGSNSNRWTSSGAMGRCSTPELESEDALQYEKELLFGFVMVPDELALHLGEFYFLAVEFFHHPGLPVIGDGREFVRQVHRRSFHGGLLARATS